MPARCPRCACTYELGAHAHGLLAHLLEDDLDAALADGLLDAASCTQCTPDCTALLIHARDARRGAMAARERHRARAERLSRIKAERDAARNLTATASKHEQTLPSAAADALARALAKARERRG